MLFPVCDFITKQEGIITFNYRAEINYFYPGFFFSISCMKFYIWINKNYLYIIHISWGVVSKIMKLNN